MAKKIKIEFKIPNWKDVLFLLKNKIKKLYSWCFSYLKKAFNVFLSDIKNKKWRGLIVLILSFGAYFLWGLSSSLLWLLFLFFLVYEWENRIIAFLALISLASCPVLLSLKKDDIAETMAVYAYFFLVMTVVLQIIEYKRDSKK